MTGERERSLLEANGVGGGLIQTVPHRGVLNSSIPRWAAVREVSLPIC
jgi:hypothetical protein